MYKVVVHKRAAKYLQKLPKTKKAQIKIILKGLANEPIKRPDVKQMLGEWRGYYRISIGNIRIIFWIEKIEKMIYVDYIGPRGDIYK